MFYVNESINAMKNYKEDIKITFADSNDSNNKIWMETNKLFDRYGLSINGLLNSRYGCNRFESLAIAVAIKESSDNGEMISFVDIKMQHNKDKKYKNKSFKKYLEDKYPHIARSAESIYAKYVIKGITNISKIPFPNIEYNESNINDIEDCIRDHYLKLLGNTNSIENAFAILFLFNINFQLDGMILGIENISNLSIIQNIKNKLSDLKQLKEQHIGNDKICKSLDKAIHMLDEYINDIENCESSWHPIITEYKKSRNKKNWNIVRQKLINISRANIYPNINAVQEDFGIQDNIFIFVNNILAEYQNNNKIKEKNQLHVPKARVIAQYANGDSHKILHKKEDIKPKQTLIDRFKDLFF